MPYYGVYIPGKIGAAAASVAATTTTNSTGNEETTFLANYFKERPSQHVFDCKNKALVYLKQNKDARLREFNNKDDAIKYAETGHEVLATPKFSDPKSASTAAIEKAAFRAPTKQELVKFRKVIESGDYEHVKSIIWDNPRYLVSSGDTPSTLKEGYRFNAMHVCALSKKPQIAELILKTVSDPEFVDLLTGKKNDEKMCKELCANLLDYYLNIPEKGRSETPLHLAAKIGSVEMVEVLTSYPECRIVANSDGNFPKDIICSRQPFAAPELVKKIETLLDERFYVPVLRSTDNTIPPTIGEPFQANNPPMFNSDPISPEVKIQALAGPMSQEQAKQFRRRWKTPPRVGSNTSSPIANNPFISSPRNKNLSATTPTKAFNGFDPRSPTATLQRRALFNNASPHFLSPAEKDSRFYSPIGDDESPTDLENGNQNKHPEINDDTQESKINAQDNDSNQHSVGEKEANNNNNKNDKTVKTLFPSTPLLKLKKNAFFTYRMPQNLDSPIVLDTSGCGLDESNVLNDSLQFEQRDYCDSPSYKERHVKISDTEKGLEVIGRELAREQRIEWREYWDFLNAFIDISSSEGLQMLENHLAKRAKEAETSKKAVKTMMASNPVDDVQLCNALEKLGFLRESTLIANNDKEPMEQPLSTTSPYMCVEKSFQVFAKRMTKTIIHNLNNVICINDTLLSELKRLKSLVCSFKEDLRFREVDFSKVHSRIANLISSYLQSSQEVTLSSKAKILTVTKSLQNTPGERREHMECVCSKIYDKLVKHDPDQMLPESLKTEDICSKVWFEEQVCECLWDSNLSRKTSRRNRMEARSKTNQQLMKQLRSMDELRTTSNGNESSDEDTFWSDFYNSDSDSEDVWYTPTGSPTLKNLDENDRYKIYVYGNEPTKRDLDVLNAIFHIEINTGKYPNVHEWKTALLRFSNEEKTYFPSPAIVKKSHSITSRNLVNNSKTQNLMSAEGMPAAIIITTTVPTPTKADQYQQKPQLPQAKRLFHTPTRSKIFGRLLSDTSGGPPKTPVNKLRGLFSTYRDCVDNSPILSLSSPDIGDHRSNSDESKNLSLLNVSSME